MDDNTPYRTTRFTRNKTEDISNMLYAKIPPQARAVVEQEQGVQVEQAVVESDCRKRKR